LTVLKWPQKGAKAPKITGLARFGDGRMAEITKIPEIAKGVRLGPIIAMVL
jgi:hypothetical protein